MALPKITDARLRYYTQEWDFTQVELSQMFGVPLEEIEYRLAKIKRDDARAKTQGETVPTLSPLEQEAEQRMAQACRAASKRPAPPPDMLKDDTRLLFAPAFELRDWMLATFVARNAPLVNKRHAHLAYAHLGVLWTPVSNGKSGKSIVGQAEKPFAQGNKWSKARAMFQLMEWFGGEVPDFVITIDAHYAARCDDWSFCALIEHELLHCGQAIDAFGVPRIDEDTGKPIFAMRPHDVEEFDDVALRYGADAAGMRTMLEALLRGPIFGQAQISGACGTCRK